VLLFWAGSGEGAPPGPYPEPVVEIAFGYTWQDPSPTWTDVTEYVDFNPGLSVRTGRSKELDSFQAGTCGFTLVNNDRRFDPLYVAGPYSGQLLDRVPVRITMDYAGIDYPLFRGFIEGWPQHYTPADRTSTVTIVASDAFSILSTVASTTGAFTLDDPGLGVLDEDRLAGGGEITGEYSGERVDALLDVAGWPDLLRDIATGSSTLQGQTVDEMLAALQLVEVSEDGFFYVGPDGYVVFHGRHDRQTVPRMAEVQATFSEDGLLVYDDLVMLPSDWELVANDVRRTREGGVEQTALDDESIATRGRRSNARSGLVMDSDLQALDLAQAHLNRYSVPGTRIDGLVLDPVNDPAELWPQVLGREILDRIQVDRTPMQLGDPIQLEVWIQGIEHTWQDFKWRTRWYVTPADLASTFYFTLDSLTLGVLDTDRIGA
jgi:hypothetical protein